MSTQLKSSVTGPGKIIVRWWKNAWNLKAPTRGLVFLFHGIGEHSGRYDEFANYMTQWGFDILSFDYPGHGLTARKGEYARFADFDEMKREAKSVLHYWMTEGPNASAELRAKPIYLMGHSMGALLALYWMTSEKPAEDFPFYPQKVLVTSPPVALGLKVPVWKEMLAEGMLTLMPDFKMGNEISPLDLGRDLIKIHDYIQDPWRSSKASPRLYKSMKKTMEFVRKSFLNLELPIMLMSGCKDPIVNHKEMKLFYENLNTHKKWVEYNDMYHEILNEIGREKVYDEVLKWFLHPN